MSRFKKPLIALAVAVGVAAVVVVIAGMGEATANEVSFQNVSDPGPEPFTAPADVLKPSTRSSVRVSGSTNSSLSGGTVCDREKLIAQLAPDPDRLSAWADAVGIDADPQAVADFIRKLRPVTLTQDTQVTTHSYAGGSAKAYQAILQKGTAVLTDADGKPVVRCRGGNPLSEPVQLEEQTRCIDCPANYRPPPPCEGRCFRPEPKAPPAKPPGAPVPTDPIATAKAALDKCRKDKGSLEKCETEYDKTRGLCNVNPVNPVCDSSVCFDGIDKFRAKTANTDACSSYTEQHNNQCILLPFADQPACQNELKALQKRCAADALDPECRVDPQDKISDLRRRCTQRLRITACGAILAACANDTRIGCQQLRNKVAQVQLTCAQNPDADLDCKRIADVLLRQKCTQDAASPDCKNLPEVANVAAPTLNGEDESADQPGDQAPGAEGDGQDTGGDGSDTPEPDSTPQPDDTSPLPPSDGE